MVQQTVPQPPDVAQKANGTAEPQQHSQEARSPRSPVSMLERPSPDALHGKPWHFGDPHSRYNFKR
jgi:hypothetical protein